MSSGRQVPLLPAGVERTRIAEIRAERGSLELFAPSHAHVLVTRAVGHMTFSMAEQWIARTNHLFSFPRPLAIFNEWALMESYESRARQLLTEWVLERRSKLEGGWFLTQSRLVAMGVAVAGSATALVGVTLHASLSRPDWEALLSARLARDTST